MIKLSTSSLYYQPKTSRKTKEERDADIRDLIERVQVEHPKSGYRMVYHNIRRAGIKVGERKIRRIMREYGLSPKIKRAFIKTTDSNHEYRSYPNHLPGMQVTGPNQVWVSDITYIRINNGFIYAAFIEDLFSRKVIGWAISKNIDTDLTLSALKMAIKRRKPPRGVIHHSDRGVQYLSKKYVDELKDNGLIISNSAKGNPYHNAFCESLIKTIKQNEVYLAGYETFNDVVENLPFFIEEVYNKKRLHSAIGYRTPEEVEKLHEEKQENVSLPVLNL